MRIYQCLLYILSILLAEGQNLPLTHGHAHNDYLHSRPLFEALENGFTSIEIDVYLHHGELKVAHLPIDLDDKQNIQQLYFDPVKKIIEQNGGFVFKGSNMPVIFMIDFKTAGSATYSKLKEILKNYESLVTVYKMDTVIHQHAINILISGNSPIAELLKEDSAMATSDGNISSMNDSSSGTVITRYSSSWSRYFSWKGSHRIPPAQRKQLDSLVSKAHHLGRQIRFYGIPDKPAVWKTLLDAGVDWINTDKLAEFRKFCEQRSAGTIR